MFTDIVGLYAAYPAWFAGSVLVIGLMVGSFLNVVIYRLPIMMEREWRAQSDGIELRDAQPAPATPAPRRSSRAASPSPHHAPPAPPARPPSSRCTTYPL